MAHKNPFKNLKAEYNEQDFYKMYQPKRQKMKKKNSKENPNEPAEVKWIKIPKSNFIFFFFFT